MLSPLDYFFWFAGIPPQVYVVLRAIEKKEFLRYFPLHFYLIATALIGLGGFYTVHRFGFESATYLYFYYYTEAVGVIFLYFVIVNMAQHVLSELGWGVYVRGGALLLLVGTACFSYLVIQQNVEQFTSRFVVELGRNLYFVGMVLTYLLWGATLQLRETRTRILQLVLSLGVYFSLAAATYAIRFMFPDMWNMFRWVPALAGIYLPYAWAWTFSRVPEEARLAPASITASHRGGGV